MQHLFKIYGFGWIYLRRYWVRFFCGVLMGVLFGMLNASFVWATKTLFERLESGTSASDYFSAKDITNVVSLAGKLKAPSAAASRYFRGRLSEVTGALVAGFDAGATNHSSLQILLAKEFNGLIQGESFYEEQRFAGVAFSEETRRLLAAQPKGSKQWRLNRLLLEDAYRNEIARSPKVRWHMAMLDEVNTAVKKQIDPWLPKIGRPIDWRQVTGGIFFFPLLVALWSFAGYLSSYCLAWVSERVVNDLRLDVLAKLNTLSLDYFNRSTMGDLLTHINGDTSALHRCLSLGLSDLIKEPMTIISVFVGLCLVDWKLTLITVVFVPLCMAPLLVLGRKVQRASRSGLKATITQSSLLVEALSNIRIVKAFNLEKVQENRYRQLSQQLIHHAMKGVQAAELVNPLIQIISMFGLGFLIVYIFYTHTSVPQLVSFLMGVIIFFTPVKKLAKLHILFQQTRVGIDRMIRIMDEQPSVKEPAQPTNLTQFNQSVRIENLSFSYGHSLVLKDIDLEIKKGARLGIAGESGSGKSTLVNLFFRFYDPTSGCMKIDGIDMRDFALRDIRKIMALVSQEVVVFDQTVAENIACGKSGATTAEIEEAAKGAYAHDFILKLPEGYNTRIGERGVSLSGGQRQRIAIARAFIRNAPILVLDEATASLDSQAEAEVQAAIDRLAENRTVVCVAHRLSTLAGMDRIIVLSQGRIVEDGAFEGLLRKKGMFAEMARRQGIIAGAE
jgi:subfamily B ATP-binding cassette protein MsbA